MSVGHKVALVQEFCDKHGFCNECVLNEAQLCDENTVIGHCSEDILDAMLEHILPPVIEEPPLEHNAIQHPNHYCRDDAMECIDEMVLLFGKEVVKHFCLCNVWKYRYRSNAKNGEEDIKKSDQYVQIYKKLCEDM